MEKIRFLQGHRLYLRPLEAADLPRSQRWINDPRIRATTSMILPMDAKAEQTWWDNKPRGRMPSEITLAIVLNAGDEYIGNTGFHGIDWPNRRATTGTIIGEVQHWNHGYATEAKWLLLKYAFLDLGLRRVQSDIYAFNEASARHLEANGYVQEGCRPEAIFQNGSFHDELLYGVTLAQFQASRAWAKYEAAPVTQV